MATKKDTLPKGIHFEQGRGLYIGRFTYNGKAYSVSSTSLKECEKKLSDLKYEVNHGLFFDSKVKFDDYAISVLLQDKTLKASTRESYLSVYNNRIKGAFGTKRLIDVMKRDVKRFVNSLDDTGLSNNSIQLTLETLSKIFTSAIDDGLLRDNPCKGVDVSGLGTAKKEKEVLTDSQIRTLLGYTDESDLHYIVRIALATGLRVGEIAALKWDDIDFSGKFICVNHTVTERRELTTPKNKKTRKVPMNRELEKLLRELRSESANVLSMNGFLFTMPDGRPLTGMNIASKLVRDEKKMAEDGVAFPHTTMHNFRHTFATKMANSGMPPKVLMSIMGHSNISITMDLYAHSEDSVNSEWMNKIQMAI